MGMIYTDAFSVNQKKIEILFFERNMYIVYILILMTVIHYKCKYVILKTACLMLYDLWYQKVSVSNYYPSHALRNS